MKLEPFTAWAIVGPDNQMRPEWTSDENGLDPLAIYATRPHLTEFWQEGGYRIARVRVTEVTEEK